MCSGYALGGLLSDAWSCSVAGKYVSTLLFCPCFMSELGEKESRMSGRTNGKFVCLMLFFTFASEIT